MDGTCAGREFQNWAVDGRNDLAWQTRFGLGTYTARSWYLTDRCNLGSWTWISGISCHITTQGPPSRTYDGRGWLLQLPCSGSTAEYDNLYTHFLADQWLAKNNKLSLVPDCYFGLLVAQNSRWHLLCFALA